jgi:hypothetical protein
MLGVSKGKVGGLPGNKIVTAYVRASIGFEEAEGLAEVKLRLKLPIITSKQAFHSQPVFIHVWLGTKSLN